jgi:choline dehydrogenase-like flavoprotein
VFPTGGYIGPTLTIVALAVRLADHLKNGPAVEEIKPLEMAFA